MNTAVLNKLAQGTRVGRWVLIRRLSKGGMGQVWLAREIFGEGLEGPVAIKFPLVETVLDRRVRESIETEARCLREMNHPNIPNIIAYGLFEGVPYLVMRYVPGISLAKLFQKVRKQGNVPDPEAAIVVMRDVVAAVKYAHRYLVEGEWRQILHLDLSPKNVIANYYGHSYVVDFGVAKLITKSRPASRNSIRGTLEYMAPEQLVGETTPAADVYGAVTILWEALEGRPYRGDVPESQLWQVVGEGKIPPITRPGAPAELVELCMLGLHPDRERRITIEDLAKRLGALVANRDVFERLVQKVGGVAAGRSGFTIERDVEPAREIVQLVAVAQAGQVALPPLPVARPNQSEDPRATSLELSPAWRGGGDRRPGTATASVHAHAATEAITSAPSDVASDTDSDSDVPPAAVDHPPPVLEVSSSLPADTLLDPEAYDDDDESSRQGPTTLPRTEVLSIEQSVGNPIARSSPVHDPPFERRPIWPTTAVMAAHGRYERFVHTTEPDLQAVGASTTPPNLPIVYPTTEPSERSVQAGTEKDRRFPWWGVLVGGTVALISGVGLAAVTLTFVPPESGQASTLELEVAPLQAAIAPDHVRSDPLPTPPQRLHEATPASTPIERDVARPVESGTASASPPIPSTSTPARKTARKDDPARPSASVRTSKPKQASISLLILGGFTADGVTLEIPGHEPRTMTRNTRWTLWLPEGDTTLRWRPTPESPWKTKVIHAKAGYEYSASVESSDFAVGATPVPAIRTKKQEGER